MIVYITIHNTDDKLPQHRWSDYQSDFAILVNDLVLDSKAVIQNTTHNAPDSATQSMCIAVLILEKDDREALAVALRVLVSEYEQNCITWDEVTQTLFVFNPTRQ